MSKSLISFDNVHASPLVFTLSFYHDGTVLCNMYDENTGEFKESSPITKKVAAGLKKAFANVKTNKISFSNILPSNLLFFEPETETLIWHIPKDKKVLFFENKEMPKSVVLPHPNLIFVYKSKTLSLFAFKSLEGENTKLYNAPFLNINSWGNVCMGNVKWKMSSDAEKQMSMTEDLFFESIFTHTNHNHLLKISYLDFIKSYQDQDFDEELLVETKKRLKDLL